MVELFKPDDIMSYGLLRKGFSREDAKAVKCRDSEL